MRKTFRWAIAAASLASLASLVLVPSRAAAQAIDFENLPAGTAVKAQYGVRGVIFPGDAHIATDPHAHSGTRVLRSIAETAEVFTVSPLVMTFTSPQKRVAFFAGNFPGGTGRGTLKAFGANNAVLAQDGPKAVPANAFTAFFEVKTPQPAIVRAEFQIEGGALELIDDLVVGGTTAPPPTSPPLVDITSPTDGAVFNAGTVAFRGTVTGPSLLDTATLRVTMGLPGDSTAPPSNNDVTLQGSGNTRTFSLDYGALTGPYTLTAIATNTANLQGTKTVHFTVLPDAIRARYDSSGGAGTFGPLRFGSGEAGCVIAVYEKGLIAAVDNATFITTGAIFQKWMAVREQGHFLGRLGCPTAEERDALGGTRAQDFRHGRIYNQAGTTAYVPEVFRDAIEILGGEETTGVALTDPTDSSGAMQTWLFQRFARLDHPSPAIEPSTLEIRGSPPVLYVERVGELVETAGTTLQPRTATVYRTFPCDGNLGPCPHVEKPVAPPPMTHADALTRCPGTYDAIDFVVEWQWLSGGDHGQTPLLGWVHQSQLSCTDNPLTHDYTYTNNSPRCKITDVFPSDWQVYVRPLPPFGLTTEDQTYLEMEVEAYYLGYFFAGWGWPIEGDLIFTNGRWIMDCGHDDPGYKAEIHPPYLWSDMSTRKRADGSLETVALIWVNGYFPGDPVDVEIWPPPRPSPDAFLTVTRPVDAGAALGLNVALTTSYAGAKATFSAPHREVEVERSGKMNWATGRGYEGEWTVYWSQR
jgi:LGFP repeat